MTLTQEPSMNAPRMLARVAVITLCSVGPLAAQQGGPTFESIPWAKGPITGQLGSEAQVKVPAGCLFTGMDGVNQFMELTENPLDGGERGAVFCSGDESKQTGPWFVVFSYSRSGYVKDDERDQLDADAILKSIRRASDATNEERSRRGWGTIYIDGWVTQPHYDTATNNLTWALTATASDGSRSVNHSVRLLGRGGVMNVDLVATPGQLSSIIPTFDALVAGYEYLPGNRYAEWRSGDKVATYGLTALVAGGAGAVAAKTGLLAKLWKLIVVGVAAVAAAVRRFWAKLTGRGSTTAPTA